jgi:hypothetical protein
MVILFPEGFELIPGLFQKLQDLLLSIKKNNLVKTISVKSGLEGKKFRNTTKRYIILRDYLRTLLLKNLSFVSILVVNADQLLVRPIELYEFPYQISCSLDS